MLALILLPFTLTASLLQGMFALMTGLLHGMVKLAGGLAVAFVSILSGLWPFLLVGAAVSLGFGILRSLWPLICIGLLVMACVALYKAGVQHAKDHPDDSFARFINQVRS